MLLPLLLLLLRSVDLFSASALMQAKKAVQNFQMLCTGDKGIGRASKKPLHYKARLSPAHRFCLLEAEMPHVRKFEPRPMLLQLTSCLVSGTALSSEVRWSCHKAAGQQCSLHMLACDMMGPVVEQGCKFHRIVAGFVCQGGDIVLGEPSR